MLRGIHRASSNWIGRAVMGVILGLIAISFGIWGIGDIFKGFGTSTVAKVGGTEIRVDTFRQLYQDRLQQLSRQVNRPITPDQAKALGPAQAGDVSEPTPEVLAKYFEERKVVFRAPEYRKITVVALTPGDIASRIEVSDADLKKAYTDRRVKYETPERRHLKQIVF